MFKKQIVGCANAIVAGWGNLGGGVTQVMMVAVFSLLMNTHGGEDYCWRVSMVFPALLLVVVGLMTYYLGDDRPDMQPCKPKAVASTGSWSSTFQAPSAYLLAVHYACCFGVELVVFNSIASYFHDHYHVSAVKAGEIALLSGLPNIISRALGGAVSDLANSYIGMNGRKAVLFSLLATEGIALVAFSQVTSYVAAMWLLLLFSFLVQASNGAVFAIVPYVSSDYGVVSGIVGSGGSLGAALFGFIFLYSKAEEFSKCFATLGYIAIAAAFLVPLIQPKARCIMTDEAILDMSRHTVNMDGSVHNMDSTIHDCKLEKESKRYDPCTFKKSRMFSMIACMQFGSVNPGLAA